MHIKKIGVIGGGTAGFVSALILKSRFPGVQIDLIQSSKIGIIGVGEGSTEHWGEFLKYIGISWRAVIQQCDATFKAGIMFKGWASEDYLHSTTPDYETKTGQYCYIYASQIAKGSPQRSFTPDLAWKNKIDKRFIEEVGPPFNQYHFNTHKLNDFLTRIAKLKDITVYDDEIVDVTLNNNGEIDTVKGQHKEYKYDFYIDCTGFKKALISKLGAKWNSYSKYLKMKSAIMFARGDSAEYNMWTTAQAMKNGWMFTIPTWGRTGNGYIFDSDYIDADQAKQEVEEFLGEEIAVNRHITFDPGALDKVWIKNCCAIGLSANFIEPLEATSIGTSIQQSFLLMHRLPNYTQDTIDTYNSDVGDILTNLRDFVILHYVTKRDDTQFWKDIQKIELPDTLKKKLKRWKDNLPVEEDFNKVSKYVLFRETNHIHIMHGLGLFDQEKIKTEYEMQRSEIKNLAEEEFLANKNYEQTVETLGHKRFLEVIRNNL
jgi:hypothetical protein